MQFLLERTPTALRYALIAVAGVFLALYLGTAISRIQYPFELEWMEGASVDTARRALEGKPIYTQPTTEYIPPIYGPLYFYTSAAAAAIFGIGFFPLRLISLLASIGCFVLIYLLVHYETRDRFPAFVAAGLFAATFQASGGFFDLARVDTLFLCLLLAGVYLLRTRPTPAGCAAGGTLLALAYLTKQSAFVVVGAMLLAYLVLRPRRLPFILLPLAVIVGGASLLLQVQSGGWYTYFALSLGGQGAPERSMILDFWRVDLAQLGIAVLLMLVFFYSVLRHKQLEDFRFYLPLAAAMITAAWFGRLRSGGWVNVLFPAFALLSIMLGLGLHRLMAALQSRRVGLQVVVYALCLAQFGLLVYNPADHLPSAADRAAGERLVSQLEAVEGGVMVFAHGHLAHMAGKPGYDLGWAMLILSGEDTNLYDQYVADVNRLLASGQVAALVADNYIFLHEPFQAVIDQHYDAEWIAYESDEFIPVTGMETRPILMYRLRKTGASS